MELSLTLVLLLGAWRKKKQPPPKMNLAVAVYDEFETLFYNVSLHAPEIAQVQQHVALGFISVASWRVKFNVFLMEWLALARMRDDVVTGQINSFNTQNQKAPRN